MLLSTAQTKAEAGFFTCIGRQDAFKPATAVYAVGTVASAINVFISFWKIAHTYPQCIAPGNTTEERHNKALSVIWFSLRLCWCFTANVVRKLLKLAVRFCLLNNST